MPQFALEQHQGPYETWPVYSLLRVDGQPSSIRVPGYALLHQFETDHGYLLLTDYDCPYEEATSIILLTPELRLRCTKTLAAAYSSYNLETIRQLDANHFELVFYANELWLLSVQARHIPWFSPALQLKPLQPSRHR